MGVARPVLCIVGSGTAGLEALLAARELLGERAQLHLLSPDAEFRYRPMQPDAPFRPAAERSLDVAALVEETGAAWTPDRAELIDEAERTVITHDGDVVRFDRLLLAAGRREARALAQGHVWQRGEDPSFLDGILARLAAGEGTRVCIAAPDGVRWPLPAYELALVLGWSAAPGADVSLVTAEQAPLAALGSAATDLAARELREAGVRVLTGVRDTRELEQLAAAAEEVISLPAVHGPAIAGVPSDALDFVETDSSLRVCGRERLWAAGGCVAAALEHSALSARQADAAVAAIAHASAGTGAVQAPDLGGRLLEGQRDDWLAANPPGTAQPSTRCLWWPPGRAVGARLARRIAALDPGVLPAMPPGRPPGLAVSAPVALGCSDAPPGDAVAEPTAEQRMARLRDIETRQTMALRRRERRAEQELLDMRRKLAALAEREEHVARELARDGYLHDRPPAPGGASGGP